MNLLERIEGCKFRMKNENHFQEGMLITSFRNGYEQRIAIEGGFKDGFSLNSVSDLQVSSHFYITHFSNNASSKVDVMDTHILYADKSQVCEPATDYMLPTNHASPFKMRGWLLSSGSLQINPSKTWPKVSVSIYMTDEFAFILSLERNNSLKSAPVYETYRVRNMDEMLDLLLWINSSYAGQGEQIRKRFSRFSNKVFKRFLQEERSKGLHEYIHDSITRFYFNAVPAPEEQCDTQTGEFAAPYADGNLASFIPKEVAVAC